MSSILRKIGIIIAIVLLGFAAILFPISHSTQWLFVMEWTQHFAARLWHSIVGLTGAYSAISSIVRLIESPDMSEMRKPTWGQQVMFYLCLFSVMYETIAYCHYMGIAGWLFDGERMIQNIIISASLVYNIVDNHRASCRLKKAIRSSKHKMI